MTPYNISVVKPEDEEYYNNYNSLQLQAAGLTFGHHSGSSPYQNSSIATPGRSGYTYPHLSTSGFVNNPLPNRPPLPHLETAASQFPSELQSGPTPQMDESHRRYSVNNASSIHGHASTFQPPPDMYRWMMLDDSGDANSPSNAMNGSPLSQGYSPLTPNTPLSTVEHSPTMSSFPSPGSQGSNEVLRLAPSPVQQPPALVAASEMHAFNHGSQSSLYLHQHGSDTHLSATAGYAPTQSPTYSQFPDVHNQAHAGALARRHSHSGMDRHQQTRPPPSGFTPYNVPSSLPVRTQSLQNRAASEVPLVPRDDYMFQNWRLPGHLIPQMTYQPHSASDRKRYVEEFPLQGPIYFERLDGPGIGITLPECVTHRFKQLKGSDDELFVERSGPSISVRINWAGYEPWSRQIPTRNFKVPQGPITRKNLAKNIARTVQRFINDHIDRPMQPGSSPLWQVGPGKIEFNDLVLLSIHHVSRGSWQANLCLNQPLEQVLNKSRTLQ